MTRITMLLVITRYQGTQRAAATADHSLEEDFNVHNDKLCSV
jgi:hypothetical protein